MASSLNPELVHAKIRRLIQNLVNIKDETGQFRLKLNDGRVIDTKSWDTDTWEWTHGIGLLGIWRYFELTKDPSALDHVSTWWSKRQASGINVEKNINTMSPFLSLACLYERTRERKFVPLLEEWAEWAMNGLNRTSFGGMQHDTYLGPNVQQLWDDTLMMTVMPITKIGLLLGRKKYLQEAKRQFLLHITYLFDPSSGAFFHGWTFDGNHNFARARWARGNSWLTIVIPDFIELVDTAASEEGGWEVPASRDPIRTHLLNILSAQVSFLNRCQDQETGMWHTLLDQDDEGSYLEASATAGFAYGMLKALRLGLLEPDLAQLSNETANTAIKATLENTNDCGELRNTSFGTGMGDSLDFYRRIPCTSMPYGPAMAVMALGEYLRK
ncbi:MAG: hypothetical protein Q9227_009313 [Pyrenula ochraceoflavens]